MIRIRLSTILGTKRITQSELSKKTGIRPGTINLMYHEYIKRVNISDINKLCEFLDCTVSDLIEYIPDKKKKPPVSREP
jgi:putative transcriptional regulator